ncbi:MAG: winged helix-turn-helix transcriptional regulator [Planctomycetota bacterium]
MRGLVHLCHHRWSIPVIAVMASGQGGRYAMLRHRLGIARETLRRAIHWLTDEDYVMPNPGYGHPLRPELLLTPWGEQIGEACQDVWDIVEATGVDPSTIGRKWSLPVLVAILVSDGRYTQIQSLVEECTPRALSQTLQSLEDAALVEHVVVQARPLVAEYRLTEDGKRIARAGLELGVMVG